MPRPINRAVPAPLLEAILDEIAERVAEKVIEKLRAGDLGDFVDQSVSPLGRRRHITAVRSGRLKGKQVGRRYLAKRQDVIDFMRGGSGTDDAASDADAADMLAEELGLTRAAKR